MSSTNKGSAREPKPGPYLKVVAHHDKESDDISKDKFDEQRDSTPQSREPDGEEHFGDGETFDDDDKAEGSGTRERRKIEIKFIQNKARRHITFSKRKHGIMKKAWELSVLTGTQVLLLVVSETGLVYTFTTPKLQPLVTQSEGKNLIQACLNAPESPLDGTEDSPEPSQADSEPELSPPPSSAPDAMNGAASANAAMNAHILALRKAQAAQDAQNRLAAQQQQQHQHQQQQNHVRSPPIVQNPQDNLSPQSGNQAAAMRAAIQAQAQAIAVSGLAPHLQQFTQGYKVPPAQYGYHGYPFSVGGQFGAQLANLSQLGGAQFPGAAPLDTNTLLAMQQDNMSPHANNEYPGSVAAAQQPPSQQQPPQQQPQQSHPPPQQPTQAQSSG